ncbi:hypothetical protein E2R51_13255 [Jeotgalibacillus sp. S-D1]|uniref:hypothetical protein n=1 Tax=Jeotgalibacillus sp. S-D1 TaxID=2552189 RepID=UPI00105A3A22|nr:hypothetical protein [Jeotgalibacillus sp. S-D1]TDL31335.1 hypothetical protein E2R51_13255 [Jeotgalibacillus sp. S-D1]
MNGHLMEILAREIIAALPDDKRMLYRYIESMEDSLAEQSQTSEQFMSMLVKHAPHQKAAEHFNLPYEKVLFKMRKIEKEIDDKLNERLKKAQWIDRTEEVLVKRGSVQGQSAHFLFII